MMAASKEFEDLEAAQKALREWRKGHPGETAPEELVREWASALECHDAARQQVLQAPQ